MAHLKMVSATTTEFVRNRHADAPPFSLIEYKGLTSRLSRQLASAARELASDPRSFIRDMFSAGAKDSKRRQRVYIGLACALVAHVTLLAIIAFLGWRTMFIKPAQETEGGSFVWVPIASTTPDKTEPTQPETSRGENRGGGGGGQHSALPPSQGRPPQMRPLPQIVNFNPSNIPEPSLSVVPTVVGPESPPPPPAPIGDPAGKRGEFSGGLGSDGGIGRGKGTGVGSGDESGAGPGSKGGKGGATPGALDGSGSNIPSAVDFSRVSSLAGYRSWSWIHRPTPIITPEAQKDKVIGIVLLRATFNADGTVSDIETVMPVEFMTDSAIESLRRSTFRPATVNGVPLTVRRVPIKIFVHY